MSRPANDGGTGSPGRLQATGGASPWSLRSYYHRSSSYYHRGHAASAASHSSVSIFTKNVEIGSTTITGHVDGQDVAFELRENVTGRPVGSHADRQKMTIQTKNVTGSAIEMRLRWWIMRYSLLQITVVYFAIFVGMNFVFAGLWYIQEGKCCDDPSLSFAQVFDYAVQTSATIGYGGKPDASFASTVPHSSWYSSSNLTLDLLIQRIRSEGLLCQFSGRDYQPSDFDVKQCVWRIAVAQVHRS